VLAWTAIMALGLREDAHTGTLSVIIGGCAMIGAVVFGGYAILFSTASMVGLYRGMRRWIESGLCVLFAVAGLKLIVSER